MAKTFPSDFYVTCATVIPVLFLAVAVQGPAYGWVLGSAERADRYVFGPTSEQDEDKPAEQGGEWRFPAPREILAIVASSVLVAIALLIVLAGGFGEGLAICVLYRGSEWAGIRTVVLVATLGLLVAVVAGPLLAGLQRIWPRGVPISVVLDRFRRFVGLASLRRARSGQAETVEAQNRESSKAAESPAPDRTTEDS